MLRVIRELTGFRFMELLWRSGLLGLMGVSEYELIG